MTLADVAALANVQRPVVSMWRKRSADTAEPFPDPLGLDRGIEVFAGHQVAAWLKVTGRGNNPEAMNDLAAFAKIPEAASSSIQLANRPNFDGLTALLALKVMTGSTLGGLSSHELRDAADECDPDDLFLYSELDALGEDLASLADFADRLADSAYNPAEAFERLLADRFRSGLRGHSDTALSDSAVELVAGAAVELAATLGTEPVFIESAKGGSDLLLGVVQKIADSGPFTVLTADDDGGAGRLVRRRLRVHGVESVRVTTAVSERPDHRGPVVHVAQYPSPGVPEMDPARILSAIEQTVLQMDDEQRAVVIAPARVLSDAPLAASPSELRSGLLRSGRVRAIVRLPQGLLRSKPREAQALWVLGPSFADVEIADKWTMVADLGTGRLTDDVIQDLLSDVVASMGDLPTVRAHSFRFARLVRTSVLLAGRGSLVNARKSPAALRRVSQVQPVDILVRIEELVRTLNHSAHADPPLNPALALLEQNASLPPARVAELMGAGHLRYVKGNRLEDADLVAGSGTRVIGVPEMLNPHAEPSRHISLLDFAARSPTGCLTAPGDVVFCTGPRPVAMVDADGGSVVAFPARVLRIDAGDPGGLVPDVVVADINSLPAADKDWKNWQLRRLPDAQRQPLTRTLARLQHEQDQARERLEHLQELATLITDGVAGGSLSLTDPISNAAALTEGMH